MVSKILQAIPYNAVPIPAPGKLASTATPPIDFSSLQNVSWSNTPFSSIVQVPITQILSQKQQKSEEAKHKKELFTLLGPLFLLLGGTSWLINGLPASVRTKLFSRFVKSAEPIKAIDHTFKQAGNVLVGAGGAFLGANGIMAGITSEQPSMIIGNILQFIPSTLLMLLALGSKRLSSAKSIDVIRNLAISATMATGAMFTVGFANEIRNKDAKTADADKRSYDMTRFKALTDKNSNMPFGKRLSGIISELSKMTRFTASDHAKLLQHIPGDARNIKNTLSSHPAEHPSDATIKDWLTKPSADKSDLAALFFYLGALPVLLFSKKMPDIANNKIVMAVKGIGMLFANLSLFSIAMNRNDFRGKAPLLGVPMAVVGMASGKQFFQGLGNAGESINNLLYSDMAVNGLKTDEKKPSPFQMPPQTQNTRNPFNIPV